jgi:hypothetical protein
MTLEQMIDLLHAALLVAMGGAIYLWWWARTCRCAKCSFHVNEQRVKRLEAERVKLEQAEQQAHLRHDADHKGWGWDPGDPDVSDCADASCPRNTRGVDSP